MLPIPEFVSSLGLGSQAVIAATLLVTAWYVYRAVGVARLVSGALGALTRNTLVVLVAAAVVFGLGWASPNAGVLLEHARSLWAFGNERGVALLRRAWGLVSELVGA